MSAQLSLAVLRTLGLGQTTALHRGRETARQELQDFCDYSSYFFFFFLLKRRKKCSKRDTGLDKLNLGFIPCITWIFKNF